MRPMGFLSLYLNMCMYMNLWDTAYPWMYIAFVCQCCIYVCVDVGLCVSCVIVCVCVFVSLTRAGVCLEVTCVCVCINENM